MNDDSPLLYNNTLNTPYNYTTHGWSFRANRWIYYPCNNCLKCTINELIPDIITCSDELKPINAKCNNFRHSKGY
jgi:hypothetical protein